MANLNNQKSTTKVTLSSNVESLVVGGKASLSFTFTEAPVGFSIGDISVKNGSVTNLKKVSDTLYTADFLSGTSDRSGMATIQLDGIYSNATGGNGTPSNTITIKTLEATPPVVTAPTIMPATTTIVAKVADVVKLPTVGFTTNNLSVKEGNVGTTDMNFTVKLSYASTEAVTVGYSTNVKTFGTAKAGLDYVSAIGNVTFAPGETTKTITVKVNGDTSYETNESFYVDLTTVTGATIVKNGTEGLRNSWAMANIVNDDVAPMPTVGFTTNNLSMKEGNSGTSDMNFIMKLSAASKEVITVNYTTNIKTFGTATAGQDYTAVNKVVTFAPGETTKTITVKVNGDDTFEANEMFYVDIFAAKGATIVTNGAEGLRNSWAMGTIINDDTAPVMSLAKVAAPVVSTTSVVTPVAVTVSEKGIIGTAGKDIIGGTAADDFIYGKGGADQLTGYAGKDTFVFNKADAAKLLAEVAQITDFKDGFDFIGMQGFGFSELTIAQGTGIYSHDTIVSIDHNPLVLLVGVNATSITGADFHTV